MMITTEVIKMSMAYSSTKTSKAESPIFSDVSIYKVVKTNKDRVVMLHIDGSVSMIMKFSGINNTAFTEDDYESIFKRITGTLNDLDTDDISVQFMMMRESSKSDDDQKDSLPSFLKPRAEYLDILAENYQLFENNFYLAVHCRPIKAEKNETFLQRAVNYYKYRNDNSYKYNKSMKGVDERVSKVVEVFDTFGQTISDVGGAFSILKSESEYYDLIQKFTRPNKSKENPIKIDNNDRLASPRQQLFSGVRAKVRKHDFSMDDYFHKVYTLDRSPRDYIFGKSIDVLESVPFEFFYSLTFRIASRKESLDVFKFKLAEKRIVAGGDEGAIVEDRTLIADEKRVSESYDKFAYSDGTGAVVSANFVMRASEEYLERIARRRKVSRDELIRSLDQMLQKRVFAKFGSSEWVSEEGTSFFVFSHILPGMSNMHSPILKQMFLMTSDIPYFIAMYDNKRALAHNGTNHFIDTRGNKVVFDLTDPTLPAWNYSISGQTGSGKSVLMNAILTMQFAEAARRKSPVICILDVGGDRGSYSKFMRLVNGTEINLSKTIKPTIQMFELIPERSLPFTSKVKEISEYFMKEAKNTDASEIYESLEDMELRVREYYNKKISMSPSDATNNFELKKLFEEIFEFQEKPNYREVLKLSPGEVYPDQKRFNLIMGVIEVMISNSAQKLDGFDEYDYDTISKLVMDTYRIIGEKEKRFPMVRDLLAVANDLVIDPTEAKSRKLLTKIKNYTIEGAYPMFDQKTSVDTTNDVLLADLKGLESQPNLQMIYTLLISQIYNDKMYFIKDRRKIIVRDEAWSLMQNERARNYFVEDLRTARKNGFATISISQLPTDYLSPDPQAGKAIISNMQVNIFCKFSTESICREVGREYNLNEEIVDQMRTLGVQKELQADGSFAPTYAKFMMIMDKSVYVLYNMLHPFEYALYSSSAEDNAVIDYYLRIKKTHTDLEEVIWLIANNKHIGDMELAEFLEDSGYSNMARRVRSVK